jgi:hypothetical protein
MRTTAVAVSVDGYEMPAALNMAENGMVVVMDTYLPVVPPVEVSEGQVAPCVEAVTPVAVAQP